MSTPPLDELRWAARREASPGSTFQMNTSDVRKCERFDYWQHVVKELIGTFELAEYDLKRFEASFSLARVGDIRIGHYAGSAQTMHRTASQMRSGDNDDYLVILQSERVFNLDHGGNLRCGRGGLVLLDNARAYQGSHPDGLDIINFFIPRAILDRALRPARLATGLALEETLPSFPMIANFLRSLHRHGATLDSSSGARMSSIAVDLIAAGFAERVEQAPARNLSNAAILYRAQAYIADHLAESGLGMQEIAASLPISVRRLHQVASEEGVSLADWMWERRLLRARDKLGTPANRFVSIGTIAYQCGFADQAHFSRRFKHRFGLTPIEHRASAGTPPFRA